MFRTVLPPPPFVDSPARYNSRRAGYTSSSSTRWTWMSCRVVTWRTLFPYWVEIWANDRICSGSTAPAGIRTRNMNVSASRCS